MSLVAGMYLVINVPLLATASWAERSADSYPWQDEDYLRFLLPSLFDGRGSSRLLITGPSEAREDLLYERFTEAMPDLDAFQAGLGGGSFQDMVAALEYLRLQYGDDALPRALLLGLTPRFIANIPREPAPVIEAITRYSPAYRVRETSGGPVLERKEPLAGALGRLSFFFKQPGRYKSASCSAALHLMSDGARARPPAGGGLRSWLYFCRSPKRYNRRQRGTHERAREWLTSPRSFWPTVHAWDPDADRAAIESQLRWLLDFTGRHGIRLFVVNLPEHPANRAAYRPGRVDRYLELVRASLGSTPFLDLREFLGEEEYLDHAHADLASAERVTARVIAFVREAYFTGQDGK